MSLRAYITAIVTAAMTTIIATVACALLATWWSSLGIVAVMVAWTVCVCAIYTAEVRVP